MGNKKSGHRFKDKLISDKELENVSGGRSGPVAPGFSPSRASSNSSSSTKRKRPK
ncbi:bacteriocin [Legionella quinlivanii]|uniref:bacteriocin n=1 Tax=Legionella quinlivanii TaxID=45073 RepID=UPI001558C0AC|nr:bacteriocin [Legionella quinlivanii]